MATVTNPTSTNPFDALGLRTAADDAKGVPPAPKENLDQSDFLRLLTTQLKNQDPLNPMQNEAFVAQMAQFSSVAGISEMNTSIKALGEKFDQNRISGATGYVGKTALVPGTAAVPDAEGRIFGALALPEDAASVDIAIRNAAGETVRTLTLGEKDKGLIPFGWDGLDDSGEKAAGTVFKVEATALVAGKREALATSLYGRVNSVNLPSGANPMTLEVEGIGPVELSDIISISG